MIYTIINVENKISQFNQFYLIIFVVYMPLVLIKWNVENFFVLIFIKEV